LKGNKQITTFAAMLKIRQYIMFSLILLVLGSCSKYQTLVKKGTPEQKYKAALKYYAKDDYYHSQQLFDELVVLYRGTNKLEKIYYYYANTYYKQGEFVVASYHFKYFAKTFPRSEFAEECLYMSAYCKSLDSPPTQLEQSSTKAAITDMQMFINIYPNSEKISDANKVMDELRSKLIVKDFNIAKLYLSTEYYRSAIYSLKQHIKDYPSSPFKEEALYLAIIANYDYAEKSIHYKQKERYTAAISAVNDYVDAFPEGTDINSAKRYLHSAQIRIKRIDKAYNKRIKI